jgi:hypothetical protein
MSDCLEDYFLLGNYAVLLGNVAEFLGKLTVSFYSVVEKEIAYGRIGCIV